MNKIHPTVVIEGDVRMGENNEILPYTVLRGPLVIGDNNIIGPHAVIGSPGQDTRNPRYDSSEKRIIIGSNNIIREFTAIQKPCYQDLTQIGNNVYLMQSVHIPHDAIIGDDVVITPMVVLAGLTRILTGANLAIGVGVSQYVIVGHYAIAAAGATVMKNIKPFSRYIPGKPLSVNDYAIKKYKLEGSLEEIREYVLENKRPHTEVIKSIVDEYERLHISSGNKQYE
ncbi:hypothetical protein ACSX1A_04535 [Pontibacter sp. MBLB2868]|uniref:hypothetical protein n=1 Tax=Pontibacter sp. MBLB2868 TaxID=3451555 RepID=UPI003F7530E1